MKSFISKSLVVIVAGCVMAALIWFNKSTDYHYAEKAAEAEARMAQEFWQEIATRIDERPVSEMILDEEEGVRRFAVGVIDDPYALRHVAASDPSPEVRLAALQKVEEQAVLIVIAKDDNDARVRMAALDRLKGDAALIAVWEECPHADTRAQIESRLSDVGHKLLEHIKKQAPSK